jgi:hypothetical protein
MVKVRDRRLIRGGFIADYRLATTKKALRIREGLSLI